MPMATVGNEVLSAAGEAKAKRTAQRSHDRALLRAQVLAVAAVRELEEGRPGGAFWRAPTKVVEEKIYDITVLSTPPDRCDPFCPSCSQCIAQFESSTMVRA